MPEPHRHADPAEGPLAEAALRLERALDSLEAALARGPRPPTPGSELQAANDALAGELAAVRKRGRKLKAAAAEASQTVGRAIEEVRKALDEDAASQRQLEFGLESAAGTGDEPFTEDQPSPSAEEPTA